MQENQRNKDDSKYSTRDIDENAPEIHVHDSSLDYKGRLPLRASTGSWKFSSFILAIQFCEIMTYFGISANMISYLSNVMHEDLKTGANNVNIWSGVATIMPLLGGFIADAYLGRYFTILFSAILYVLGLSILTMTQYIPSLKPCNRTSNSCNHASKVHEVVYFIAIYFIAVAAGGYKPCSESFGADQFDENHPKERIQKLSFFNWINFVNCCGMLVGITLMVYVQENVSWGIGFLILAITMGIAIIIFVIGRPFFRFRTALGSPLTPLLQVFVAAIAKRNIPCPSNSSLLYENFESEKLRGRLLSHTDRLRFFDKAAIIEKHESDTIIKKQHNPWRLATVTQVEELKLMINMFPIWLTSLVFGIGNAQGPTFFIKQGDSMNRKLFKHFEIPAASMIAVATIGMMVSIIFYDKILLPYLRRTTSNERGMNILTRIGIGMIILILSMMLSAIVEKQRLDASLQGKTLHILWLVPQIFLLSVGDGFSLVGLQEYFYDQVPDAMRSLGMGFYLSVIGVGSFLTSLLITIVDYFTGLNGGKKWIDKDINHSRVDKFYWLLTVINVLNFCVFVMLAKNYRYKNVKKSMNLSDSCDGDKKVEVSSV